jgi:hypothetical protein
MPFRAGQGYTQNRENTIVGPVAARCNNSLTWVYTLPVAPDGLG